MTVDHREISAATLLADADAILLDFDGPVCSIFGGTRASDFSDAWLDCCTGLPARQPLCHAMTPPCVYIAFVSKLIRARPGQVSIRSSACSGDCPACDGSCSEPLVRRCEIRWSRSAPEIERLSNREIYAELDRLPCVQEAAGSVGQCGPVGAVVGSRPRAPGFS
jgi:hypothetical protein